jgi:hypothetical protein
MLPLSTFNRASSSRRKSDYRQQHDPELRCLHRSDVSRADGRLPRVCPVHCPRATPHRLCYAAVGAESEREATDLRENRSILKRETAVDAVGSVICSRRNKTMTASAAKTTATASVATWNRAVRKRLAVGMLCRSVFADGIATRLNAHGELLLKVLPAGRAR